MCESEQKDLQEKISGKEVDLWEQKLLSKIWRYLWLAEKVLFFLLIYLGARENESGEQRLGKPTNN